MKYNMKILILLIVLSPLSIAAIYFRPVSKNTNLRNTPIDKIEVKELNEQGKTYKVSLSFNLEEKAASKNDSKFEFEVKLDGEILYSVISKRDFTVKFLLDKDVINKVECRLIEHYALPKSDIYQIVGVCVIDLNSFISSAGTDTPASAINSSSEKPEKSKGGSKSNNPLISP